MSDARRETNIALPAGNWSCLMSDARRETNIALPAGNW
jgi:hypothetical protein